MGRNLEKRREYNKKRNQKIYQSIRNNPVKWEKYLEREREYRRRTGYNKRRWEKLKKEQPERYQRLLKRQREYQRAYVQKKRKEKQEVSS